MKKHRSPLLIATLLCLVGRAFAAPPAPYPLTLSPGTQEEQRYLGKIMGATVEGRNRHADKGRFWAYGLPVVAGSSSRLSLQLALGAGEEAPTVTVVGANGKPLPIRRGVEGDRLVVEWTVPANWTPGARMTVVASAKTAATTVGEVTYVQSATASPDGLPEGVAMLMKQGLPADAKLEIAPAPAFSYIAGIASGPPTPETDLCGDSMFVTSADPSVVKAWKDRGYIVWTLKSAGDGREYAAKRKDEIQAGKRGEPFVTGDEFALAPTMNRVAVIRAFFNDSFAAGATGVSLGPPEYHAGAGYEEAFRQEWKSRYKSFLLDPEESREVRYQAGELMADLEMREMDYLFSDALQSHPKARRKVGLHSPIYDAMNGLVCPHSRIVLHPAMQDFLALVGMDSAAAPVRVNGVSRSDPFAFAYLECSAFARLAGQIPGKRLRFVADPALLAGASGVRRDFGPSLVASLLFPEADGYCVLPQLPATGAVSPDSYTQLNSIIAALEEIPPLPVHGGNAMVENGVGVLLSDSAQFERAAPNPADFDGFFGLALPFLERGVPVQILSLERATEPGYLAKFKTLLLSYDFQKPASPQVHAALVNWVKQGGALLFFGGADADAPTPASWRLKAANPASIGTEKIAPQDDLLAQLGIALPGEAEVVSAKSEEAIVYESLLRANFDDRDLKNRRIYSAELTSIARKTGSVVVRFSNSHAREGSGPFLLSAEMSVGGKTALAFRPGSQMETRFLCYDNHSAVNSEGRFGEKEASWTYRFDNLPRDGTPVVLNLDIGNGFEVSAASADADSERALVSAPDAGAVGKAVPHLRVGPSYPVVVQHTLRRPLDAPTPKTPYSAPTILYRMRAGGAAIWSLPVERGFFVRVGVAPSFFASGESAGELVRSLTRYAAKRVGGTYAEAGSLDLQRGRYHIVATMSQPFPVSGRTADVLSPNLEVVADRVIPSHSTALLCEIGETDAPPGIGFVSGRVQARIETPASTVFLVRGALGTMGAARLRAGGKRLASYRATDRFGRPLSVQARQEGDTALLRYPNDPDGVIVRAAWQ